VKTKDRQPTGDSPGPREKEEEEKKKIIMIIKV
jgi:hypothetical protein